MGPRAPKTVTFVATEAASEDSPERVEVDQAATTFTRDLDGRYERRRVLGQGGMGIVVLVHDRTVGRNVALKQLNDDVEGSEADDALARFAREARVQGQRSS